MPKSIEKLFFLFLFLIRYFLHLHFQCYPKSPPCPPPPPQPPPTPKWAPPTPVRGAKKFWNTKQKMNWSKHKSNRTCVVATSM